MVIIIIFTNIMIIEITKTNVQGSQLVDTKLNDCSLTCLVEFQREQLCSNPQVVSISISISISLSISISISIILFLIGVIDKNLWDARGWEC